jgi:hypothetical protein
MALNYFAILGICAAIINAMAFVPYIRTIVNRKTLPERASWWIWSILMSIALAAQIASGATWSALLTAVFFAGNIVVAFLSLRYGYGRFGIKDGAAIVAALIGVALWAATNNPLIALLVTVAVDFMAYWLTIIKSWKAPYSENLLAWSLMTIAAILSILSVGEFNVTLLLFPVYVACVSMCGVIVLVTRRKWRSKRIKEGLKKRKVQA